MDEKIDFIRENYNDFEQLLTQLVAFRSVSNNDDDMTDCIEFLQELLVRMLQATVSVIRTSGAPTIVANVAGQSDETVLFYGHYDTMPSGPIDLWKTDPFNLTFIDGRYFGRGVGDNKGQLLAQILGIYTYKKVYGNLPCNIVFLIEGEEEKGSVNLPETVEQLRTSLLRKVDLAIVVDGSINQGGDHVLRLGNRGVFGFEISVVTGKSDNHSGNAGNIMDSAAGKIIATLSKLYDFTEHKVMIPNFYNGVPQHAEIDLNSLMKLPYDQNKIMTQMGLKEIPSKIEFYERLMYQPTFNIAGISSGYTEKGLKTVIPHTANVKIDCRLVGNQSIEAIKQGIEKKLATDLNSGEVSIKYLVETPPSTTKMSDSEVNLITSAIETATGSVLVEPVMAGTVPNYVWTNILKVPVVTIPYANYDQHNHAPNENLTRDNFIDGIKISYELIKIFE
ncbi:M20/M25/M40 family metallo-hydrolase [Paucilactobacillus kaifaensis]|uniref:M20/M25/M40 family metallo-hydrolase n=1 Tax=Paucilactobacillus kaifaensis TaxID=2559921 RepID=UPI0010F957C8|nr:M20/M25/M40 family metallo-hydrolase [Paucilactobacillus kaifaensis]